MEIPCLNLILKLVTRINIYINIKYLYIIFLLKSSRAFPVFYRAFFSPEISHGWRVVSERGGQRNLIGREVEALRDLQVSYRKKMAFQDGFLPFKNIFGVTYLV